MHTENKSGISSIAVIEQATESKFYYGWLIAILGALSVAISTGIIIGAMPLFYRTMTNEFGWTRTTIGIAGTIALMTRGITSMYSGKLWDKYGTRRFVSPAIMVTGIALACGSLITNKYHLYLMVFTLALAVSLNGLAPCTYLASTWFTKHRGIAVGVVGIGASVGGTVFSRLTPKLVGLYGWRSTFVIYGIVAAFIISPLIFLLLRDRSTDTVADPSMTDFLLRNSNLVRNLLITIVIIFTFFYTPFAPHVVNKYGSNTTIKFVLGAGIAIFVLLMILFRNRRAISEDKKETITFPAVEDSTNSNALASSFFWLLVVGSAICYIPILTIPQHFALHLQKHLRSSLGEAGMALSTIFFFSMVGRFSFGYLSDRFNKRIVNLLCGLILLSAVIAINNLTHQTVWLFCFLFGIGYSGITVTGKLVLAERFGMKSFGKLLGIMFGLEVILGGFGSIALGIIYDKTGSYDLAFKLMIGSTIAAALCMALLLIKPKSKIIV